MSEEEKRILVEMLEKSSPLFQLLRRWMEEEKTEAKGGGGGEHPSGDTQYGK